jgi:hypothetical protein
VGSPLAFFVRVNWFGSTTGAEMCCQKSPQEGDIIDVRTEADRLDTYDSLTEPFSELADWLKVLLREGRQS